MRHLPVKAMVSSVALLLVAFSAAAADLREAHVPATAWIGKQDHALRNSLKSFDTDDDFLTAFGEMVEALAARDWTKAARIAKPLRYEVVSIKNDNSWLIVASDTSRAGLHPIIVMNADPKRDLIAEAPHVPFERGTAEEAVAIVERLGARAALISGADRCASRSFTACDGKTEVCGRSEAYRETDVGHNPDTLFHLAHTILAEAWPNSVVISLHGMREDDEGVRTSVIVSNGAKAQSEADQTTATGFRKALGEILPAPGRVVSCNLTADAAHDFRKLCGTTNVQGRHVNGDDDICKGSVDQGTGRFIHLEQDWTVLAPFEDNWTRLDSSATASAILKALGQTIPLISPP